MKKLLDLKKVFNNLELEGQGRGIIMGVTCLLLLGQFYTIQTKTNKKIQTNYNGTLSRTVFISFLEEFGDAKKAFRN